MPPRDSGGRGRRTRHQQGDGVAALWCPHCKTPFVGPVGGDGTFVHLACGGASELDLDLLDDLATDSWFWRRYRDRLRSGGSAA